jgi:hypothetical protein
VRSTVLDYMNTEISKYRKSLASLLKQRDALEAQAKSLQGDFVRSLVSKGWKEFQYSSSYYGSHQELGEGDESYDYLFHPDVDISLWENVGFSHGHMGRSENSENFDSWLSGLDPESYVEL